MRSSTQRLRIPMTFLGSGCSLVQHGMPKGQRPVVEQEAIDPPSEAFVRQMISEEHFSGVALVMREGKVVHANGYGSATRKKENSVSTAFHVASLTKQFTAAAILQFVERGAVDLHTSVNEYLPPLYRSPQWGGVTIHHLLSHTSGVPDYALQRDYYHVVEGFASDDTVERMIKEAIAKDLEFPPRTKFSYSNIGYTLLGVVIESRSGMSYAEYLAANLFAPMGMDSSGIHVVGQRPSPNDAAGHRWNEELDAHVPDEVVTLPATAPDGGLITTLTDFARWTGIYMEGEQTVLSQESVGRMVTPVMTSDEASPPFAIGYGLLMRNGVIGHMGFIVGFRSHFIVVPKEKVLVAVFSNNTTNDPTRIAEGLLALQ